MSLQRIALICLTILAVLPAASAARLVDSISPSSASPGEEITVTGGPFADDLKVVLGGRRIDPHALGKNSLRFTAPDLPEGTYVLGLFSGAGRTDSALSLQIIDPAPEITGITPEKVDNCDKTRGTAIAVEGKHFTAGSRVLLDGAAITSRHQNGQLVFTLPTTIEGGQHEIEVVNPDRKSSLAVALQVETQPEIYSVSQGEDRVNSYEVIIAGRNFLQSSAVVVNGRQVNNLPREVATPPQSDHVRFVDCRKLIYIRYPYSRELHDVNLQIINPDGKESPVMSVAIP